jgi:hypothetical protein
MGVEADTGAGDDTAGLQLAHSFQGPGRGHADAPRQLGIGDFGVFLKKIQDLNVNFVEHAQFPCFLRL